MSRAALSRTRMRAPREHGEALVLPPLASAGGWIGANQRSAGTLPDWLRALRASARSEMLDAAIGYTSRYRNVDFLPESPSDASLILSGHQPQLFHAGVWFKSFALSSLARRHQAIGINLIVDNDTCRTASIRVPSGSREAPQLEAVLLDAPGGEIPFEERAVVDRELFASFADRVSAAIEPWIADPLVRELWPNAVEAMHRTGNLGQAVANARHQLEGTWGRSTLELPLSEICSQRSFRQFLVRLFDSLASLRETHNAALLEYRRANRIRSRSHPVPELAEEDGWLEAPLWIWSKERPRRRRLFVRRLRREWQLSDRESLSESLPIPTADDSSAVVALESLHRRGVRIRPRALITTMYARMVLSDLFLHGIGGAKYDELTDAILARCFHVSPPAYLTATATLQLPLAFEPASSKQLVSITQQLRDLRYHAERSNEAQPSELAARKREMLQAIPPRGKKRAWHEKLTATNQALQPLVAERQAMLERQAAKLAEQVRRTRLLASREFSFVLFPADFLRALLLDLAAIPA
jgi:hypothetical protein